MPHKKFVRKRPRKVPRKNEDKQEFYSTRNHIFLNAYYEPRTEVNKADTATVSRELRV